MKARTGRIISISSVVGHMGNAGQTNYAAAKAGMSGFTKSLAREVGEDHITVNALSPAATNTPLRQELLKQIALQIGEDKLQIREEKIRRLYPVRRIGEVSDVSNYVMYLASDYAKFITGQIISVNGGYLMPG
jgi:NAD(P)-dependent dehydrogenase (short-subunit alcohol dehydrogenase family)